MPGVYENRTSCKAQPFFRMKNLLSKIKHLLCPALVWSSGREIGRFGLFSYGLKSDLKDKSVVAKFLQQRKASISVTEAEQVGVPRAGGASRRPWLDGGRSGARGSPVSGRTGRGAGGTREGLRPSPREAAESRPGARGIASRARPKGLGFSSDHQPEQKCCRKGHLSSAFVVTE